MRSYKLYMLLLGCKPKGRHTEQHDIFFTIGTSLKAIIPDIKTFWPDGGTIHIDAWREVNAIDGYSIAIKKNNMNNSSVEGITPTPKLFFINLGGYKPGEFEEYHYRTIISAANKAEAIKKAKESAFYLHTGFKGASSHIDDKYGIDVDDFYKIEDILPENIRADFNIIVKPKKSTKEDQWHIGYTNLSKIK